MKLSTKTIPTLEMTAEEELTLRLTPREEWRVLGAKVVHWDSSGLILLDGETVYRQIVRIS